MSHSFWDNEKIIFCCNFAGKNVAICTDHYYNYDICWMVMSWSNPSGRTRHETVVRDSWAQYDELTTISLWERYQDICPVWPVTLNIQYPPGNIGKTARQFVYYSIEFQCHQDHHHHHHLPRHHQMLSFAELTLARTIICFVLYHVTPPFHQQPRTISPVKDLVRLIF